MEFNTELHGNYFQHDVVRSEIEIVSLSIVSNDAISLYALNEISAKGLALLGEQIAHFFSSDAHIHSRELMSHISLYH
jgi:hypothetical protein